MVDNLNHLDDNDFKDGIEHNEEHDEEHNECSDEYTSTLLQQPDQQVEYEDNNTFVSKQCDNYNFWLSERDFYPPEDNRYHWDKKSVLGSKNMYVQYLSEFYDYYKECFEDMFEE